MAEGAGRVAAYAPAKVNLSLVVAGKRPDGYHELISLMAPVSLFDRITIEKTSDGKIAVESGGSPHVEGGEKNICHRAAAFYFRVTGLAGGVSISVEKKIPVGAGLGGGSSDAATTILTLEKLFGKKLTPEARMRVGFEVGADVPFFFARGPAYIRGIGEKVEPVADCAKAWLVVVHPGVFLSTGAVFSNFNIELTRGRRLNTIAGFDFQGLANGLVNDLETPALKLEPRIGAVLEALRGSGAVASLMTGSGSACFGLFPGERQARAAEEKISANAGAGWFVKAVRLLTDPEDFPPDE